MESNGYSSWESTLDLLSVAAHDGSPEVTVQASDDALCRSDLFMMYCFKILPCKKTYRHDWRACPYSHDGETAKRRDPRRYAYVGVICPEAKRGRPCPRGESCPCTHSLFEYWLHPTRYKTEFCSRGRTCNRAFCFFAHSEKDTRQFTLQESPSAITLEALRISEEDKEKHRSNSADAVLSVAQVLQEMNIKNEYEHPVSLASRSVLYKPPTDIFLNSCLQPYLNLPLDIPSPWSLANDPLSSILPDRSLSVSQPPLYPISSLLSQRHSANLLQPYWSRNIWASSFGLDMGLVPHNGFQNFNYMERKITPSSILCPGNFNEDENISDSAYNSQLFDFPVGTSFFGKSFSLD